MRSFRAQFRREATGRETGGKNSEAWGACHRRRGDPTVDFGQAEATLRLHLGKQSPEAFKIGPQRNGGHPWGSYRRGEPPRGVRVPGDSPPVGQPLPVRKGSSAGQEVRPFTPEPVRAPGPRGSDIQVSSLAISLLVASHFGVQNDTP